MPPPFFFSLLFFCSFAPFVQQPDDEEPLAHFNNKEEDMENTHKLSMLINMVNCQGVARSLNF